MSNLCLLCGNPGELFHQNSNARFELCTVCSGIFVPEALLPPPEAEVERYVSHNNDVEDPRYQKFVAPIVEAVKRDFSAGKHNGLDFGAGTGPVITKLLREAGYNIAPYDPFFCKKEELLRSKYDFIVCCEVMEHFHRPLEEFRRLKSLLRPGGKIYCMTHLYSSNIDFKSWYYKNDPTHVIIYQRATVGFLTENLEFTGVDVAGRLITFKS